MSLQIQTEMKNQNINSSPGKMNICTSQDINSSDLLGKWNSLEQSSTVSHLTQSAAQ